MARFEITGPDGSRYEVDVPSEADLPAAAQHIFSQSAVSGPIFDSSCLAISGSICRS